MNKSTLQYKSSKDRTQIKFWVPIEMAEWIREWGIQERKSQTRIIAEILEAEKKRRGSNNDLS